MLISNENFLLFGANCSENCLPVTRFLKSLVPRIQKVESTTYSISCESETINVKFEIAELPNDMKMLAYLGGELSNSAKYFSSFADVSTESLSNSKGTFGHGSSDTWKPWKYNYRLKVVEKVEKLKTSLRGKKLADSTKRSKVTSFISAQKSRQEFIPLIGQLIDRAHVDPLHLKNNICALAHRHLLNLAIAFSNLSNSVSSFAQLPQSSPLFKYVNTLKTHCFLSRLAKKVVRWFNDTGAKGKEFECRFTGRDSRFFLYNFMFLVEVLDTFATGRQVQILHVHSYLCLCLRDCVALFSRVNITDEELTKLRELCFHFCQGYRLFFHINPTIWTLGYVVPTHAEQMKSKYGLGLGLNSMEGREAKHIAISRYSKNTTYQHRWNQIFLHEYISLIWLREKGYNTHGTVVSKSTSYIPARVTSNPEFCYCGLKKALVADENCRFCSHPYRNKIKASIVQSKVLI